MENADCLSVDSSDDGSDEDLPSVSSYLSKDAIHNPIKSASQILTPRKAIKPELNGSPSRSPAPENLQTKSKKFSIGDLLKQKKFDDDIQRKVKDIIAMENVEIDIIDVNLTENKKKNCTRLVTNHQEYSQDFSQECQNNNEDSSDEEVGSKKDILTRDYPDSFPGRKLFVRPAIDSDDKMYLLELVKFLEDETIGISVSDVENEDLSNETCHELLIEILEAFLHIPYLPREACKIIWKISFTVENYNLSHAAAQCLINYVSVKKFSEESFWRPSLEDFLDSLISIGAKPCIVSRIHDVYPLMDIKRFELLDCSEEEQFLNSREIREALHERLYNFESLIKIITIFIQMFPLNFSIDELKGYLILLFNLAVDKVVQMNLFDVKILIGSILDTYSTTQWKEEIESTICTFLSLNWHHRDIVHCVECIPPTKRGSQYQQLFAINAAIRIVNGGEEANFQADCPVKLQSIYKILSYLKIDKSDESVDYFEMSSIIYLVSMCSKLDSKCGEEKLKIIKVIINELTLLNDVIKECMGQHLDRTKLKNQVIRLISKYKEAKLRYKDSFTHQSQLHAFYQNGMTS